MASEGSGFKGAMPAGSPTTHVPTLPPRGPAVARYFGVAVVVACAAVTIVVVSLIVFLPKKATTWHVVTPPPAAADPVEPPFLEAEPVPDLAELEQVPLSSSGAAGDMRSGYVKATKKRGLLPGDVPAVDAAAARALSLQKKKKEAEAEQAWKNAQLVVERAVIDRGVIQSKQKRLRVALEERGTRDGKRVDELLADVDKKLVARDYEGANDSLNKAFALLK